MTFFSTIRNIPAEITSSQKTKYIWAGIFLFFVILWWFSIPRPLFPQNYSQIVFSREGELLGARIASDQQWRFPASDTIPYKFKTALLYFEDEYFYHHPGFNPISLTRAFLQNLRGGKISSGGSTLSMQTIRLSRNNPPRTYWEKGKEIFRSVRLELGYNKDSIISMYASHAPFGGNVVGVEAAAWRYFGKLPHQLSWSESATLAVLPNAPSLIFPGKNQELLLYKRNRLLKKLHEKNKLNKEEFELALTEPLPQKPYALPQMAPHWVDLTAKKYPGNRIQSTIDYSLQNQLNQIVEQHRKVLSPREIQNIAVIVSSVQSGEVLAYVGNTSDPNKLYQNDVDINQAIRSSGSILKPLLFMAMLDNGELLPNQLLTDVPSDITENFSQQYQGVVPANEALIQSLNIPAIQMLRMHGVSNFHSELKQLGFTSLTQNPSHYGLSLIVGGGEISPWELNNAYRNLAAKLCGIKNTFYNELKIVEDEEKTLLKPPTFSEQSIYLTFNELRKVSRPSNENGWRLFGNAQIAWKTGTSHGFKDAWSVGISKKYIVTVWVGNADGEGRPGIIGVQAAAPILFDVFGKLPSASWFAPKGTFKTVNTCSVSGFPKGNHCLLSQKITMPNTEIKLQECPFHQRFFVDNSQLFRVNASCYPMEDMRSKIFFILPPVEENYFKRNHPSYTGLPPFYRGCESTESQPMDFIYPRNFTHIFLPKNHEGKVQPMIVKVAHKDKNAVITWSLDGNYLTQTQDFHEFALQTSYGKHILTLTDQAGNSIEKRFDIASQN